MTGPDVLIPRTAVVPAAGLGTWFLPATKTVPKELLPVVDTPGSNWWPRRPPRPAPNVW